MTTQASKVLWGAGIFSAVLSAVLISIVNDARAKLEKAVIDNVRQDSEIQHMNQNYDEIKLELRDIKGGQSIAIKELTRIGEHLKTFEPSE